MAESVWTLCYETFMKQKIRRMFFCFETVHQSLEPRASGLILRTVLISLHHLNVSSGLHKANCRLYLLYLSPSVCLPLCLSLFSDQTLIGSFIMLHRWDVTMGAPHFSSSEERSIKDHNLKLSRGIVIKTCSLCVCVCVRVCVCLCVSTCGCKGELCVDVGTDAEWDL